MEVLAEGTIPTRGTPGSAGGDLRSENYHIIPPGKVVEVRTNTAAGIPLGWVGFVIARSSLHKKYGLKLVNGIGVIDSDYHDEILLMLENFTDKPARIESGDRLAQLVTVPCYMDAFIEAKLEETGRGGFGSTGKK